MYSSTHMSIAVNHLVSVLCIVCNLKWCVWCTGCLFWWNCCFKALTLVSWWMNNWVNIFHQSPKQHIIFLLSVKRYLICSHTKLWWKIVISKLNESTSPFPFPSIKVGLRRIYYFQMSLIRFDWAGQNWKGKLWQLCSAVVDPTISSESGNSCNISFSSTR